MKKKPTSFQQFPILSPGDNLPVSLVIGYKSLTFSCLILRQSGLLSIKGAAKSGVVRVQNKLLAYHVAHHVIDMFSIRHRSYFWPLTCAFVVMDLAFFVKSWVPVFLRVLFKPSKKKG